MLALASALASGCRCPQDACGGCGTAQICDAQAKSCQPAIAEGQPCLDGDGGPLPLPCQEATQCETALAPAVCAQLCDPAATQPGCAGSSVCWQLATDAGSPVIGADGTVQGVCAGIADAGQGCGVVGLSLCAQGLSCVLFTAGAQEGVCFVPCDPTSVPDPCAAPTACLAVFADPTMGVCATPGSADAPCDDSLQLFCPKGQLCLGEAGDAGSCYVRCPPGDANACPELEGCVLPTEDPTVGVCAQAQGDGAPCDPAGGVFCDAQSFCLEDADGGASCHAGCTGGTSCPPGQSCLQIQGSGQSACG